MIPFMNDMEKLPLLILGIAVLLANLFWLLMYLFYGAVQVYNLREGKSYAYLGSLWIEHRRGQYLLCIPEKMLNKSYTTNYKIRTGRLFAGLHGNRILCIRFGKEKDVCVPVEREMIAKNYVAT